MRIDLRVGPLVVPFYIFFGGEGSPTKIDKTEKQKKNNKWVALFQPLYWRT